MGLKFAAQYMLRDFPDIEAVAGEVKPPPFHGAPWPGDMERVVAGCWTIVNALAGHYPPGSFIHAVLMNNLSEAFKRADESNTRMMWSYVAFLYNHVPATLLEEYRKFLGKTFQT